MPDKSYKLWKQLYTDGYYTKSYGAFKSQFADPAKAERLYTIMTADKMYSRTADEFAKQFFNSPLNPSEENEYNVIDVQDTRETDVASGNPLKDTNRLHANIDTTVANHIIQKAKEHGIDPYTALAIAFQETGFKDENLDNPFNLLAGERLNPETANEDIIDLSMKTLQDKNKLAQRLGKKTDEDIIQAWNGYGKVTKESFGGKVRKVYGIDVTQEPLDMSKNPVYGKRVVDIRENILKKNPQIVKLVEGAMKLP